MSPIKRSLFLLLVLLFCLAGCSPAGIQVETNTPASVPVSIVFPQPTRTNSVESSPISPTATKPIAYLIPSSPPWGMLVIEIVYSGQWYRETFDYAPDAANIHHMVLVMPENSDIILTFPGWVFSSLTFTPYPEPFIFRPEVTEYQPLLKYLYDAPAGLVDIVLPYGRYNVAVAFIAAAPPPPDGDAILYPGVTGGGASNEFRVVEVKAGETTHVLLELTDENGWGWLNSLALK
jgi:hypothetical protein